MTFRTLLVHVDTSAEGRFRLENAVLLAGRFGAKLVGLGAAAFDPLPDRTGMTDRIAKEWIAEALQESERIFRQVTAAMPLAAWRTRRQRPASALSELACGADLVIGSRTSEIGSAEVFARPDELVLSAGVPVLIQPPAAAPLDGARVVFGWKNTRESRRAAADALPFLTAAKDVLLLRFAPDVESADDDGLADVAERLRSHGVAVTVERRERQDVAVGEDLIAAATSAGADLIVAGAYGQPRVRDLILGGVTRHLLASSPKYVLLSH